MRAPSLLVMALAIIGGILGAVVGFFSAINHLLEPAALALGPSVTLYAIAGFMIVGGVAYAVQLIRARVDPEAN